jgi:predicted dehydrogenase
VVGADWWATTAHIPALRNQPLARLIAVQSRDIERARRIARDFQITNACATMEEVLAVGGIDGVVISSTPNAHFAQTYAALLSAGS